MATPNEAVERIYSEFVTGWGATSPFTFDNKKYDPPANTSFVRVTVRHTDATQDSLGSVGTRKFDRPGTLFIQCFSPLDIGRSAADNLALTARNLFEGKTLTPEGIRFFGVTVREIGLDGEGMFQINVEAPFEYTETR